MDKTKYIGKKVIIYPNDSYKKLATIIDVDDVGFTFKIEIGTDLRSGYKENDVVFYSHNKGITMKFIQEC